MRVRTLRTANAVRAPRNTRLPRQRESDGWRKEHKNVSAYARSETGPRRKGGGEGKMDDVRPRRKPSLYSACLHEASLSIYGVRCRCRGGSRVRQLHTTSTRHPSTGKVEAPTGSKTLRGVPPWRTGASSCGAVRAKRWENVAVHYHEDLDKVCGLAKTVETLGNTARPGRGRQ